QKSQVRISARELQRLDQSSARPDQPALGLRDLRANRHAHPIGRTSSTTAESIKIRLQRARSVDTTPPNRIIILHQPRLGPCNGVPGRALLLAGAEVNWHVGSTSSTGKRKIRFMFLPVHNLALLFVQSSPLSHYWRRLVDPTFRGLYQVNAFDLAIM